VYVIGTRRLFTDGGRCYVGMSLDLRRRMVDGHLRDGGTRADSIIAEADVVFATRLDRERLAEGEVLAYLLTQAAGLNPVNAVGSLGQAGAPSYSPVISSRLSDGVLAYHDGATAAGSDTGVRHAIGSVLSGSQNAAGGYTYRYATDTEIRQGRPLATRGDARFVGRAFHWTKGGVPAGVRAAFARSKRRLQRKGGYYGVTRTDRTTEPRWTARVVEQGGHSNNPKIILGRDFRSERSAFAVREAYLDEHPELAPYNRRGPWGCARPRP
jgi:hypothetical protein